MEFYFRGFKFTDMGSAEHFIDHIKFIFHPWTPQTKIGDYAHQKYYEIVFWNIKKYSEGLYEKQIISHYKNFHLWRSRFVSKIRNARASNDQGLPADRLVLICACVWNGREFISGDRATLHRTAMGSWYGVDRTWVHGSPSCRTCLRNVLSSSVNGSCVPNRLSHLARTAARTHKPFGTRKRTIKFLLFGTPHSTHKIRDFPAPARFFHRAHDRIVVSLAPIDIIGYHHHHRKRLVHKYILMCACVCE